MISRPRVCLAVSGIVLSASLALISGGVADGALSREVRLTNPSDGTISAHLTKRSFEPVEAGKVKLIYRFSQPSRHFAFLLTRKNGMKWLRVRSVKRMGNFNGSHTTTVKKLFSAKTVKPGRYRLRLTADGSNTLLAFTVAAVAEAGLRTIRFYGYSWHVKAAETRTGPGPNYFSDEPAGVWVDKLGRLHLRIVKKGGRWYCSEVYSAKAFGYGTYTFTLASRVDRLDKNAVLGLFTWDDNAPEYNFREIDIEFSRWGDEAVANAQFVVQPWARTGNEHRFELALNSVFSTHSFQWNAGDILFSSHRGHAPALGDAIETWSYAGADIPPAGAGNARINLWLMDGTPPSNGQGAEVVVESFRFTPGT